jgi:DNA-binding transcriptional ArsR family regulator
MTLKPAVLQLLASPRRQEILRMVWHDEQTAGAIRRAMPDVTFGAVSLQLKGLLDAGLVEARAGKEREGKEREGKQNDKRFRYYKAKREALGPMAEMLERMWDDALWKLKLAAELEQRRRGPKPQRRKRKGRHA